MTRIALLDDYQRAGLRLGDWSPLAGRAEVDVFDRHVGAGEAAATLARYDVLCTMRERMPLPGDLLAQLPALRLITVTGRVPPNLDLAAATARGIVVCHTRMDDPGLATTAAATPELAWGLILAAVRKIPAADRGMREGLWQTSIGTVLHGKTLGLLGLGRIGRRVAGYGRAFGMRVIAWSPNLTDAAAAEAGVARVEKAALFGESDVVSIHVVLGLRSRGTVTARELALMKPTATLVNTSRGPIVDQAALLDALLQNRIAGAALDVFDEEPLPADHPLRRLSNVVLTPHLGYVTEETLRLFWRDTVEAIAAFLDGRPVRMADAAAFRGRPG